MATPDLGELVTSTARHRAPKIKDNVTDNNAFLRRLKEKGKEKSTSGGTEILEPLLFAENPNTTWYDSYDPIPVGASDVLSDSRWAWKQLATSVTISGREQRINSGKEAVLDLLGAKMDAAEASLKNQMSTALYGDGTAAGGKAIVGLGSALSATQTSGTYGNIDRATWTFWRANVNTVTTTSANIREEMAQVIIETQRGTDQIDLILSGNTKYLELNTALQGLQSFTNPKLAEAGFQTLRYMGADVVLDGGIGGNATATTMYFLNTNYWQLRYHPEANFSVLGPQNRTPANQDAIIRIIGWMGALTNSGLQFQGVGIFA